MFVIALTGGIGCGKSEAAKIFVELGVPIVDLDVISHQITSAKQPLVAKIAKQFGAEFVTPQGELNRAAMRKLIFNDEVARKKLNAITHPAIFEVAVSQLNSHTQAPYTILAIPLLIESSQYMHYIDKVLVINCDEKLQIKRVKARSHLTEDEVLQIIHAQSPRQDILSIADDIVDNNGDVAELRKKIEALHQKYINTCIVSKTIS